MTDLLFQFGISNLCISLGLAIVAWIVQTRSKRPHVAHLLWLLVLVKLVTPPIWTVPVVAVPGVPTAAAETLSDGSGPSPLVNAVAATDLATVSPSSATASSSVELAKIGLALLWLLGSAMVLAGSLVRVVRFNRLLRGASELAPPDLQGMAAEVGERLGLKRMPVIYTTSANLSPMVWWIGGRIRVVVPAVLCRKMDRDGLRWILAHELAHVRRRDHLVRWLEWLACVAFWWNPVVWWTRRNLRVNEEVCCDALVLSGLNPDRRKYANALMTVVEFLTSPAIRPPAMASEISSGGFLERRFKMIVSSSPMVATPHWLRVALLLCAVGLLPLGLTYAQEPDYEAVGERLIEAVKEGELTREQATAMMGELARVWFAERLRVACQERDEDDGIESHFHKLGVSEAAFDRIVEALKKGGIREEQLEKTLGGILRTLYVMREKGERYEMDPALIRFLKDEVRLTKEQIGFVQGVARRILYRLERSHRQRGEERGRVSREDYTRAATAIRKAIAAGKVSEEAGRKRLAEMRRAMADRGGEARKRDLRKVYAGYERRVKAAVEAGKISEEEAKRKLVEFRKGLGERERRAKGREKDLVAEYRAYERRIKALVEAGKMSEEEAERKLIEVRQKMFGRRKKL